MKTKHPLRIIGKLFPLLFSFSTLVGQAGTGRINGYLHDTATGEPLMYANVILKNTGIGAASDVAGYFNIIDIPAGKYTLTVSMIGYEKTEKEVFVLSGLEERHDFNVNPKSIEGDEVIVTGDRQRFEKEIEVSSVNLSMREVKIMPAFIEADIFRTAQLLPGVQTSSDFSSALVVRGGSPDENLIMLDGIEIYNPFHLGGVFSTFNADAIADVEFLTGGYPARYGNRISSVLNLTSRTGDSKQHKFFDEQGLGKYFDLSQVHGEINLLSSKIVAEGPICRGSWVLSARRTYFDEIAKLYYYSVQEPMDWKYYFYDVHGKVVQNLNSNNRVSISSYGGLDHINFEISEDEGTVDFDWTWGNSSRSIEWRWVPNTRFVSTLSLAGSEYHFNMNLEYTSTDSKGSSSGGNYKVWNAIEDWTIRENLDWYISSEHKATLGLEVKNLGVEFDLGVGDVKYLDQSETNFISSTILQDRWQISPTLMLQTGIRISKYSAHSGQYFEPRVGVKYLVNESLSINGAWGKYNQFLFTAQDENTLASIVDFWNPIPKNYNPKSAQHFIVGLEQWIGDGWKTTLEAYYKPYSNILAINPAQKITDPDDDYTQGTAHVMGAEFMLKKSAGKITGWFGVSYMNSQQEFDFNGDGQLVGKNGEIYKSKYDQPFSVNCVVNYALSKSSFGLTVSGSSSNLYTPTIGYIYTQNGSYYDFSNPYSSLQELKGAKNSARYPEYFRMDVSYSKNIHPFGLDGKFKIQVINVTNHFNTFFYNWELSKGVVTGIGMFPFLPTFGIELSI